MSEAYLVPGNALLTIAPGQWAAQTFTPLETHVLDYIDLQLMRWAAPWDHLYEIYHTDADGLPTGTPISTYQSYVKPLKGITYLGRHRYKMSPVTLYFGVTYAIVIRVDPADPIFTIFWQYEQWTGNYPRGERLLSNNNGVTWMKFPTDDHIFAEFGDPPLPKPEPPPPIEHFAVMDLIQTPTPTGISITIPTNVPCHLTCYWTDKKPLKHHTSRVVRGKAVPWKTYFCFVAWHEVKQTEDGDTLYHTFDLSPWAECETRWLTFRGTVDEVLSPSVGPIFEKHCDTHLYELTCFARPSMARLKNIPPTKNYLVAHDSLTGEARNDLSAIQCGQHLTAGYYYIYRIGMLFDTTPLPSNIKIISAKLHFRTSSVEWSQTEINIVNGSLLNEPITGDDYHDLLTAIESYGKITGLARYTWYQIPLNNQGKAQINSQALTKFALRSTRDINTIPAQIWQYAYIWTPNSPYSPYLVIKYIKLPP